MSSLIRMGNRVPLLPGLILLLIAGCGGNSAAPSTAKGIQGDWLRRSMVIDGKSVDCPDSIEHGGGKTTCRLDHFRFLTDGTFSDGLVSGTWKIDGETLTLTAGGVSRRMMVRIAASGEVLEMDVDHSGPAPFRETAIYARYDADRYEPPIQVGEWRFRAIETGEEVRGCAPGQDGCDEPDLRFFEDGTYTREGGDAGIWKLQDETLTLQGTEGRVAYPFRFLNNRNSFVLGRAAGESVSIPEGRIFSSDRLEPSDLVFNPAFQVTGDIGAGESRTLAPGADFVIDWQVLDHSVTFHRFADRSNVIDLNADGPGTLRTVVPTVPGFSYVFELDFAANPARGSGEARIRVQAGNLDRSFVAPGGSSGPIETARWRKQGVWFTALGTETAVTLTASSPASGALVRWADVLNL